jgi:mannose-6-phosphate isomerase-like protein (cupin superfamily)
LIVNYLDYRCTYGYSVFMPVLNAPTSPTHNLHGTAFTSLATKSTGSTETSVWRVDMQPGTPPSPHQLTREEVFVVWDGVARVKIGGVEQLAERGDVIVVPPATLFELSNAGDEMLSLIACMPFGGQAIIGDGEPFTPPWSM